jgi:hypothetical protein
VKDENGYLLAHFHNVLNRLKKYSSQLMNVHSVSDVRQTAIHTAEPLVPCLSCLESENAIAKLMKYKSSAAELFQAGEILLPAIHKILNSIWNQEQLSEQWKMSITVPIKK